MGFINTWVNMVDPIWLFNIAMERSTIDSTMLLMGKSTINGHFPKLTKGYLWQKYGYFPAFSILWHPAAPAAKKKGWLNC
jgi:hypothetical protein